MYAFFFLGLVRRVAKDKVRRKPLKMQSAVPGPVPCSPSSLGQRQQAVVTRALAMTSRYYASMRDAVDPAFERLLKRAPNERVSAGDVLNAAASLHLTVFRFCEDVRQAVKLATGCQAAHQSKEDAVEEAWRVLDAAEARLAAAKAGSEQLESLVAQEGESGTLFE
jgi:hypothetical protein